MSAELIGQAAEYLRTPPATEQDEAVLLDRLTEAAPAFAEWLKSVRRAITDHPMEHACGCSVTDSYHRAQRAAEALMGGRS